MEQGENFDLLDAPQGKYLVEGRGAGTAGFVIGIIALVLWIFAAIVAYMQAVMGGGYITAGIWSGISVLGFGLSAYGFGKLKRTGGKAGLSIAGMACSGLAILLCAWMFYNIGVVRESTAGLRESLMEINDQLKESLDSLKKEKEKR